MNHFEKQGGISFLLIHYSARNVLYYMRIQELNVFWERAKKGGRKSFRFDELDDRFFMELSKGIYVPYLDMLQKDLNLRDD